VANQKCDVAPSFQQPAAEISTHRSGADNQNAHPVPTSVPQFNLL
jgi:hypothetical protein